MNHNTHKPGFSLIEALMAIALAGIVLVAIFGLQNSVFDRTTYHSQRLQRMMMIVSVLADPSSAKPLKEKGIDKKIKEGEDQPIKEVYTVDEPPMTVTMKINRPKNKKLHEFKHIKQMTCSFEWQSLLGKEQDALTTFFFQPPQQEKP